MLTEIIFIGTGTGIPSASRAAPSILLSHDNTLSLIDCGAGTLRQLQKIDISYNSIDNLLFTHLHPDHIGDLVPYLFATRNRKYFNRTQPVNIFGPNGFNYLYDYLRKAFGQTIEPPEDLIHVIELSTTNYEFCLHQIEVSTFKTTHTISSIGYIFKTSSGKSFAVTGDTGYSTDLVNSIKGVDLLITECSYPDSFATEGHLTPFLAGKLALEAGVKSLALTHFYPEIEGHDLKSAIQGNFKGVVYLAEDFQKITL